MASKTKTWATLYAELASSMRKWGVGNWSIEAQLQGRYATRRYQTLEERAVTLHFRQWVRDALDWRECKITMRAHERALENLQALVQAVEHVRMADVRGITKIVIGVYRQLHPLPPVIQQAPAGSPRPAIAEHYQRLGILPDAPLEVAEAAYKALARRAHPDAGGSTVRMQQLNAAIEQIRKEKVK